MKAICVIASDNVVVENDVVFNKTDAYAYCLPNNFKNFKVVNCAIFTKVTLKMSVKLKLLWLWHMIILKKQYVYLTGVNR